uniref:Oxysterol-binding protein n=1 Tax=Arcella intermedia TaxID=1963864 RepID=A0A6B2L1S1_9EUKA
MRCLSMFAQGKASLPAELTHPFSMLELLGYRELQLLHVLFEVNNFNQMDRIAEKNRFLSVVKWYLGLVKDEILEKNPFNPVLGEIHFGSIDNAELGISEFLSEQVSHHPPVSAFILRNLVQDISISGNVGFKVGFGQNQVTVTTRGDVTIQTKFGTFKTSKCFPDMVVNNILWGEKYLVWKGIVHLSSTTSNFAAQLKFDEGEGGKTTIKGEVFEGEKVLLRLEGIAGGKTFIIDDKNESQLFMDVSQYHENKIIYLPEEFQTPFNSLKVWEGVKKAIIANNMAVADEEKRTVENEQRKRNALLHESDAWMEREFFSFDPSDKNQPVLPTSPGIWHFKPKLSENFKMFKLLAEQLKYLANPSIRDITPELVLPEIQQQIELIIEPTIDTQTQELGTAPPPAREEVEVEETEEKTEEFYVSQIPKLEEQLRLLKEEHKALSNLLANIHNASKPAQKSEPDRTPYSPPKISPSQQPPSTLPVYSDIYRQFMGLVCAHGYVEGCPFGCPSIGIDE